ncbi:hypothetical protein B1812_15315 [Methylocystis bryophila]|uniref:HXXEE domain-containing protein n=2 Tax=Methylocystis bryophila TaxID=655015 RepID=A0A1W6N1J7_9HYPH|nr:hypothetical protein B1812_15315 [Methylocystis bryophila]
MAALFVWLSSGWSLIATFIPGVVSAWAVFSWLYARRIELPEAETFIPAFFVVLAIQFLHFNEEYITDFRSFFPELYGGAPFSGALFVTINMVSYSVFAIACLAVFAWRRSFLLMPVLFFVVYGAIGNAISHTFWVIDAQAYRPGFVTAQFFWLAGPWLLRKLLGSWRATAVAIAGFASMLVPLLKLLAVH